MLCSKLRQFSYEEIEFFLPQLCHLLISIDNESMALEEFIIDLCEESVNGALLVLPLRDCDHADWLARCANTTTTAADILALPNLPQRPLVPARVECIPDLSQDIQQSTEHCLWRIGTRV